MMNFLKKNTKVISNFSYLTLLQLSNLVIPIITYPYLLRVLGSTSYGKVIYAQVILTYYSIFVNFGLNIVGIKEVSIYRNNITKLNKVVSGIYTLKVVLFVLSILVFALQLYLMNVEKISDYLLYLFSLWVCLNELLFPIWYFQGVERMQFITVITLINKILVLVLIFIMVKSPKDYYLVPLINLVGIIVASAISFYILRRDNIRFKLQSRLSIIAYLKRSYVMAISYGLNTFKTNFNVVVIKHFFTYKYVAYFDLANKITNIGITFLDLISQAIYPKMSIDKDRLFLRKIIWLSIKFSLIIMLVIQIFSPTIIKIMGGKDMNNSIDLLRILVIVFPIYVVGALLGRNGLIVHGYNAAVLWSMFWSAIFYCVVIYVFIEILHLRNINIVGIAFLSSFLIETLFRLYYSVKKKVI